MLRKEINTTVCFVFLLLYLNIALGLHQTAIVQRIIPEEEKKMHVHLVKWKQRLL